MNVGELKKILANLPDDKVVVLAKDAEGNGYSPLSNYWNGHYVPETTWYGEVWSEADEREWDGDIPEDAEVAPPVEAVEALVLWPVN